MYAGLCILNSKPLQTGCVHGVTLQILAQIIVIFYLHAINIFWHAVNIFGQKTHVVCTVYILNAVYSFYDTA